MSGFDLASCILTDGSSKSFRVFESQLPGPNMTLPLDHRTHTHSQICIRAIVQFVYADMLGWSWLRHTYPEDV